MSVLGQYFDVAFQIMQKKFFVLGYDISFWNLFFFNFLASMIVYFVFKAFS